MLALCKQVVGHLASIIAKDMLSRGDRERLGVFDSTGIPSLTPHYGLLIFISNDEWMMKVQRGISIIQGLLWPKFNEASKEFAGFILFCTKSSEFGALFNVI